MEHVDLIALDRLVLDERQPRRLFAPRELELLKSSMRALGRTTQYITVRPHDDGTFLVEAGARRVVAARELGWTHLPAVVHTAPLDPGRRLLAQVAENAARANLVPIELCDVIGRLYRQGHTPGEIAEGAGLSLRTVYNYLAILEHDDLVERLRDGASLRSVLALAAARDRDDEEQSTPGDDRPPPLRRLRRGVDTLVEAWPKLTPRQRALLAARLRPLLEAPADLSDD